MLYRSLPGAAFLCCCGVVLGVVVLCASVPVILKFHTFIGCLFFKWHRGIERAMG